MERSRKLTLTNFAKANNALIQYFDGKKLKLTNHLNKVSRTTVTDFFQQKPVPEAAFHKICLALRLNWKEVSAVEATASKEDWIEEVRSRCCEKILYQHGTIQLLNGTEIGVDQLYVDVWLLNRSPRTFQVSESTMLKSFDLRNDRLGLGDRIKRNEGIEVANDEARLLILGKPGAGKTTFLKHLAVDCSKGNFPKDLDLIPVLIELRRIQSTEWKLLDAISEELRLENQQTKRLLEHGKLLILMDGLDEVPTNGFRRAVQNQVRALAQEPKYSGNRFILTCRTQIIEIPPLGFTSVEVADFRPKQVKEFVENWFRATEQTEEDVTQQWQAFSDATTIHQALKELTVTPVLLSLMCLVLQDEGNLPSQAASLYRKGIRLLLEKWNDRKEISGWEVGSEVYRKLEPEQKEALLTEVAAQKFENPSNFVLFEQKDLAEQITNVLNLANVREGEAVLKAIEAQHGLLVERADELWSFSHLTFQEYFTVQWLTQLSPEQLDEKIANLRWQEVVRQLVRYQPADKLLKLIKQAIDYSVSGEAKLQEFLTWVQEKAEAVNASCKPAAIRAFYFDCALVRALGRALDLNLDRALGRALDLNLDCAPNLNLDLNLDCALGLARALDLALDHDHALALDHDHDHALARALNLGCALAHARDLALNLDCALDLALDLDVILANTFQQLKAQLPEDFSMRNWKSFRHWWRTNGQSWIEELSQIVIGHRNIGHDWQFTKSQKQALQRYHDANKFLVELLQQPGAVSDTARQEIEDNLLLPIATLRERQPDMYGK